MMRRRSKEAKKQRSKDKNFLFFCFFVSLLLCFSASNPVFSIDKVKSDKSKKEKVEKVELKKINEAEFKPVLIGALLQEPEKYIGKKIRFRGKFSSFTTLALDYEPALRKPKDYISLCIFRPDSKIPLSELKLAYPVKEAKENITIRELEEGDLIEIFGKGFSSALDEPWVDILAIKKIESAAKPKESPAKELVNKDKEQKKESQTNKHKNNKHKNKKQKNKLEGEINN